MSFPPSFNGDLELQKQFLDQAGIHYSDGWTGKDTEAAHTAWHLHVLAKRGGSSQKRPIADILIGAFASNRRGLITRNPDRKNFPKLEILEP